LSNQFDSAAQRVEILDVRLDPVADWVLEAALLSPRPDAKAEAYANTYSLPVWGWAIAKAGGPLTVELHAGRTPLAPAAVNVAQQDAARRHPDAPGAEAAGFQTVVGTVGLPPRFEVTVELIAPGGERSPLACITGRRRLLQTAVQPTIQPVLVTTLGRTGSSWLVLLLASHPDIVSCRPFKDDPRLTSYWTEALRGLAEPASYIQMLRPELYPGNWWTGEHRPGPLPVHLWYTNDMTQWLGGDNVEATAQFCQRRIEEFYLELARCEHRSEARYFVEKCWPDEFTPRTIAELYPEGREIFLVRDFRDMVCSMMDFNAKRGINSFGREQTGSDEEFIYYLRGSAEQMIESWRSRRERAYLMRYEDLILHPEVALADALRYIGVAADPGTVTGVIEAANTWLPAAQRDHQTSGSPATSVGRWRRELSVEQQQICEDVFGDILAEFGYERLRSAQPASAEAMPST
jgi:hypothetical protein